jgi:hypothetical protein
MEMIKWEIIQEKIDKFQRGLNCAKIELSNLRASCMHEWGKIRYTPEIFKARTIPGREGQGSHPPVPSTHVPEATKRMWTRQCEGCGLEVTTKKTKTDTQGSAISGCVVNTEVPDWSVD